MNGGIFPLMLKSLYIFKLLFAFILSVESSHFLYVVSLYAIYTYLCSFSFNLIVFKKTSILKSDRNNFSFHVQ